MPLNELMCLTKPRAHALIIQTLMPSQGRFAEGPLPLPLPLPLSFAFALAPGTLAGERLHQRHL